MNEAQGAGATDASEETTPQQPQTTQPAQQQPAKPGRLLSAVLQDLELPAEVLGSAAPKAQGEPLQEPPPREEQPQPPEPEPEPEPEPAARAPESQIPQDWPEDAKAQVFEERRKRRERTEELNAWKETAQQLNAQIQQRTAAAAQPLRPDRPIANAATIAPNLNALALIKSDAEQIEEFCDTNPDGADNVLLGRGPDGQESRRDYTPDDIRRMKADAKAALRQVPVRAVYLSELQANAQLAQQLYPEMFQEGTEEAQAAATIIQAFPEIQRRSDYPIWIGDVIAGTKQRISAEAKKNGQRGAGPGGRPLSPAAQGLINAPKMRVAPGVATRRGSPAPFAASGAGGGAGGGEAEQAREKVIDSQGGDDELEKYVRSKLSGSQMAGRGGRQRTLA